MKFDVTIDQDEDGVWIVQCPSIPGCVSQGKTKDKALENVKDAIQLCLDVRAERGLSLAVETRQVEVAATSSLLYLFLSVVHPCSSVVK